MDMIVSTDYNARGIVTHLYKAAYKLFGKPLCLTAAEKLANAKNVLIVTGFRIPRFNGRLSTDGPFSASLLAAYLERFLGSEVIMVTDEGFEEVLSAGLRAAGAVKSKAYGLPLNIDKCMQAFENIVEPKPDLSVAIERPAANKFNVYHNSIGQDVTHLHAPLDLLLDRLRKKGVPLIAYGDGGNEVGMGLVREAVEKYVTYGAMCTCGCRGGIASNIESDILVVSSVSDIGVFGTISLMEGGSLKHMSERLGNVLKKLIEAGCVDARKGQGFLGVDGVDISCIMSIVNLLSRVSRSDAQQL